MDGPSQGGRQLNVEFLLRRGSHFYKMGGDSCPLRARDETRLHLYWEHNLCEANMDRDVFYLRQTLI